MNLFENNSLSTSSNSTTRNSNNTNKPTINPDTDISKFDVYQNNTNNNENDEPNNDNPNFLEEANASIVDELDEEKNLLSHKEDYDDVQIVTKMELNKGDCTKKAKQQSTIENENKYFDENDESAEKDAMLLPTIIEVDVVTMPPLIEKSNILKQSLSIKSFTKSSLPTKIKKTNRKISTATNRMSKSSVTSFIRRLFTCGISCYSCSGLRRRNQSLKSNSNSSIEKFIQNSPNPTNNNTTANMNTIQNENQTSSQNNFKKLDQVIQYSSVESIINKFDDLKKKQRKKSTLQRLSSINTSKQIEKSSKNPTADALQTTASSSINIKNAKIKNENSTNSAASINSNDVNSVEINTKIILPILKINDDIVDISIGDASINQAIPKSSEFLDNEENEDNTGLEESYADEEEPEDFEDLEEEEEESVVSKEGEDDEEEEDEEEEYDEDLDQEVKILKQLSLNQNRIYDDFEEEAFAEFNDDYEDEDEDGEENRNKQNMLQLENNSKVKSSLSASPLINSQALPIPNHQTASLNNSKNNNKYLTNKQIPSISFDEAIINHDQSVDENDETSSFSANISSSNNTNPSVNVYSKFLTANNLMTDRGGVVNIRTGSFNLGCQQDQLSDELTDSYEFFNSIQNSSDQPSYFTRSCSNYSFKNSLHFNDSNYNGAANLLVPLQLIKNRKKSTTNLSISSDYCIENNIGNISSMTPTNTNQTSNSPLDSNHFQMSLSENELANSSLNIQNQNISALSANSTANTSITLQYTLNNINNNLLNVSTDQDQVRRCSHDPNIEKLHKTFINNVRLGVSHPASSHISSSSSLSQNTENHPLNMAIDFEATNSKTLKKSTLNNVKKMSFKKHATKSASSSSPSENAPSSPNAAINNIPTNKIDTNDNDSNDKLELESTEKSDVLNEINKVNKWLRDNKNHHKGQALFTGKINKTANPSDPAEKNNKFKKISKLPSITISEDEDITNFTGFSDLNTATGIKSTYGSKFGKDEINANSCATSTDASNKTKNSFETNDSAIDIRSYGSISTLSKASSSKSRVNWQSFSKYYRMQLFQTMDTTWSKYQISAMSLEQLMALRKLALIQFSKLVERQHSSMIKSFRLFSKKTPEKVYDSIDSLDTHKSSKYRQSTHNKDNDFSNKKASNSMNDDKNATTFSNDSVIIGNKKISHQLGAQIGTHPSSGVVVNSTRKRRKTSLKKLEKHLFSNSLEKKEPINQNQIIESASSSNDIPIIAEDQKDNKKENIQATQNDKVTVATITPINSKSSQSVVFGVSLISIMQHTGQPLPQHILEAMRFIRKVAPNEIGIFRKNGNKSRINRLKESINKNEKINFYSDDITVFDIADTIKLYFRELPECLITNKLSDILLTSYLKIRPEERKIILQQLMLLIPDENRLVLQTLILFLSEIAKHYKTNQMTRTNLAVCFSPVIFSLNYDNKKKIKPHKMSPSLLTVPPNPLLLQVSPSSGKVLPTARPNSTNVIFESIDPTHDNSGVYYGPTSSTNSPEVSFVANSVNTVSSFNEKQIPTSSAYSNVNQASLNPNNTILQADKSNSKRKYSEKFNKAATSIVNFGVELSSSTSSAFFSDSFEKNLSNLEYMSKVVQMCVADMIKYSMDLFTVPFENFDKLKLAVSFGSEPYNLEYLYDMQGRKLKKVEFFTSNINIQNAFWFYLDKFEDVSIYFLKNEQQKDILLEATPTTQAQISTASVASCSTAPNTNNQINSSLTTQATLVVSNNLSNKNETASNLYVSQKSENFNDKLRLWKCCTLVKHQNLTLDKILNRIKNERHMWDDDFKEGKIVESLDEKTELYRYVITCMPPHASRDFFEIRHSSVQNKLENETVVLTSTSVQQQTGNKLIGDIRANMLISKYVIEKLIATDTTTTFKITHYIKLDYKGFTLEFYNKTFGYMMARLLFNLKLSLLELI